MIQCKKGFYYLAILFLSGGACQSQNNPINQNKPKMKQTATGQFVAGKDYVEFSRVKIMDQQGFAQPAEAYSIMLPKGWTSQGGVFWTAPGNACAGTNMQFVAQSPDRRFSLEILPALIWSWSSNPQANQLSNQYNTSRYCAVGEPIDASQFLKNVWAPQLGGPSISDIKENPEAVQSMSHDDIRGRTELMRYGAAQVNFRHTGITAKLNWNNDTAGLVVCGVTNVETYVPNNYTGTYDVNYTSYSVRVLFRFPKSETAIAERMMSVMISALRTNPDWKKATDEYWKEIREKKHVAHIGTIKLIDERTRQIGNTAIANGNRRLAEMDNQLRSWETQQSSQDRIHSSFIKTIREVENYRDESGKYELSSGFDHAWSRGDGVNFIMTNNPNLDPSSVFQDQRWKEMKKVE